MSHHQRQQQASASASSSSGRPGGPGTPLPSFAELMQTLNIDDRGRLSPNQRGSNSPPSRVGTPRVPAPQPPAPPGQPHHISNRNPPAGSQLVLDARSMRPVTPPAPRTAHQAENGDGRNLVFRCEYCGRGFDRRSTLKTHENAHTEQYAYTCTYPACTRSYAAPFNAYRHVRTSHGLEGEEARRWVTVVVRNSLQAPPS